MHIELKFPIYQPHLSIFTQSMKYEVRRTYVRTSIRTSIRILVTLDFLPVVRLVDSMFRYVREIGPTKYLSCVVLRCVEVKTILSIAFS